MRRREVLTFGAAAAGLTLAPAWADGAPVSLIMPAASPTALTVKVRLAAAGTPALRIDGREAAARPLDARTCLFTATGLRPGTSHRLELIADDGRPLREPWTLATLPAPDALPARARILLFTCAGGDPATPAPAGKTTFLAMAARHALLDRALSFRPDLVVANGDHVYWDQAVRARPGAAPAGPRYVDQIAPFDEAAGVDAPANRRSLDIVIDRQIANLYGERLAGVPTMFVTDDHDYFENDNAGDWGSTFPPRPFVLALQRRTAALAYPAALGRRRGAAWETVESVRLGRLIELVGYDCRQGLSMAGEGAFLTPAVERYVTGRTARSDARHLLHMPSTPFGWTAGKWGEWYPDRGKGGGRWGDEKTFWKPGFQAQHQRLAAAMTARRDRAAVTISGDLHASAAARITASGDLDLSANPITAVLAGPLGSGDMGFPSEVRGEFPWVPKALASTPIAEIQEKNGFTLIDVTPDALEVRLFTWRPPEPLEAVANLQPRATFTIRRPA